MFLPSFHLIHSLCLSVSCWPVPGAVLSIHNSFLFPFFYPIFCTIGYFFARKSKSKNGNPCILSPYRPLHFRLYFLYIFPLFFFFVNRSESTCCRFLRTANDAAKAGSLCGFDTLLTALALLSLPPKFRSEDLRMKKTLLNSKDSCDLPLSFSLSYVFACCPNDS